MQLPAGSSLGPYEILGLIGAGGMGEVYRARDARLGRDVAVKVLPAAFAADRERLRRFEQEARSAGRINHPNILAIYDVGTHEGQPYLVTEFLAGQTLRVEVTAKNCGLHGGPQLRLSDQENNSLATAIGQLDGMFGSPLAHVEDIESLKVFYAKKRIKMIFEAESGDADSFVVRYADQPLNGTQRREFESLMAGTYGITVLSTEKCYAD